MEENIQKYELQQEKKIYIVTTSLINNKILKICCFPNFQKFGYMSEFSFDDLVKINQIFSYYKTVKEIQYQFEKCILEKKVSLLHNRTLFDIIFYIDNKPNQIKISLRLNYQGMKGMIKIKPKIYNLDLLNKIEQDTTQISKEQSILREKIDQILSSNYVLDSINESLKYSLKRSINNKKTNNSINKSINDESMNNNIKKNNSINNNNFNNYIKKNNSINKGINSDFISNSNSQIIFNNGRKYNKNSKK